MIKNLNFKATFKFSSGIGSARYNYVLCSLLFIYEDSIQNSEYFCLTV